MVSTHAMVTLRNRRRRCARRVSSAGRPVERHGALAQAVHALGQGQDLAHVLVHHERRGALPAIVRRTR